MRKRFAPLLTLLTALFVFNACDDAPQITKPIIDEILTQPIPVTQSRYTGRLQRVGTVENFGLGVDDPVAIEWNSTDLYMIAKHGSYPSRSQYLFRVDRQTGVAVMVNPGARDLGGSFGRGRGFTQVLYVSPSDMTWHPDGQILAVCGVLDSIVSIDLETGLAGRISWEKDFCLRYPEGDSDFDREFGGYRVIGAGTALAWTEQGLYMWGISGRNNELVNRGYRSFGRLYKISENLRCATPIGNPVFYGQPTEGPLYPDEGEAHASSFCFDGEHLYMSGSDTQSLYILDPRRGELYFVAKWVYAELPPGHAIHDKETGQDTFLTEMPPDHDGTLYCYRNIEKNICFGEPEITGLAFDGVNLYAVCGFTDALYIVE